MPPWCSNTVVEEKPAAGKAPAKSKDKQTPSPPAAEKAAKKRTADEAGLPAEEPAAKAAASAEAAAEDYSKMTVAQLKEKLKGALPSCALPAACI